LTGRPLEIKVKLLGIRWTMWVFWDVDAVAAVKEDTK